MSDVKLVLLVALVSACAEDLIDTPTFPPSGDPPPCPNNDCNPPPPPPPPPGPDSIELGDARRVAAGTSFRFRRPSGSNHLGNVELTSSDPSILTAQVLNPDEIELIAHAPGVVTLEARRKDFTTVLDTLVVTSVPVSAIEVFFRAVPGANGEITQFAGVVGSVDDVCMRYRGPGGANGELLPGRGQFTSNGAAIAVLEPETSLRISESYAHRSTCVRISFAQLGTAQLVASLEGGISKTIPIEVVTAPASAELLFMVLRNNELVAVDPVDASELVGVDFVARTGDGRFVGGVKVTWSFAAPAAELFSGDNESVFVVSEPGTGQVTATAGALVRTKPITAQ